MPASLLLPVSLSGHKLAVYKSMGYENVPDYIEQCTIQNEKKCIDALIAELNDNFNTELCTEYASSKALYSEIESEDDSIGLSNAKFIVCGVSHAGRLVNALDENDLNIADLSSPGWKITDASVAKMEAELREKLEEQWDGPIYRVRELFLEILAIGKECLNLIFLDRK
jgi:hypothetical protein